ncbi:MFS transporter [Nocardioides sp. zg-536]|uniref:MFS transporter n=1 Tax=Nocardioides faecalis TaxID=2803858 RepID=A0A938XZQ2_9ACTN|nr:MFS transporter [Nocardioides faecalis]MBM9459196.1 MFS transporter [Nocardioides faecalis]MBS4751444.1 MFS transporter [Nocardioides faecalis]QVI59664.1 MFS transporter [Nocardioides faecalis]
MTNIKPASDPADPGLGTATLQVHARGEAQQVDIGRDAPFGWWPAIVIALVAFIDRVEINLIAGALPAIQDHFGFSDTVGGAIPTAASIAAAVLLLPAGRLADRAPRVGTIAIVVLIWSLCSVLSGLASTFFIFFLVRIAIGAAGQLYNPPASSLLADYYPNRSRGKAYGFERAGYYMGLPTGVIVGGAVAEALDWRAVFFIAAIPGLVVAALVLTLKEPRRGLGDAIDRLRAQRGAPDAGEAPVEEHAALTGSTAGLLAEARSLLKVTTLRGVIAAQAILALGVAGLFYWLPTFLERLEGLDTDAASGLAGGVGGTGIVIGIIIGSRLGDRRETSGWRIKLSTVCLLVGAIGLSLAVLLPGVGLRMTMVAVACAGFAGAMPNLTAAAANVVPAANRGMGFALLQFLTTLGGAFGPLLVGAMSDLTGGIGNGMLFLIPPLFISVLCLWLVRDTYDADAVRAAQSVTGGPAPS